MGNRRLATIAAFGVLAIACGGSPANVATPPVARSPAVTAPAPITSSVAVAPAPIASPPRPPRPARDPRIARLMRLAEIFGELRFRHPYVFDRAIDLDAAMAIAIPKVSAANDEGAEAAAIAELFAVLHDPQTRVDIAKGGTSLDESKSTAERKGADGAIRTERGVVVIPLIPLARGDVGAALKKATEAIAKADAVVIDLRPYRDQRANYATYTFIEALAPALVSHDASPPAHRWIQHEGFTPQRGTTSGSYRTYFASEAARTYHPNKDHHPARVAFVVDDASGVTDLAAAMHRRGDALLVGRGPIDTLSDRWVKSIPIGTGHVARIRRAQSLDGDVKIDIRVDDVANGDAAVDRAIEALVQRRAPQKGKASPLSEAHEIEDPAYADEAFPTLEHRLLGAFRLWNAIRLFYPYGALMEGSWDEAFEGAIPTFEKAATALEYAQAIARFATHIPDSHVWVRSSALREWNGDGMLNIELQRIEGLPVVVRVDESAAKEGLAVGDVILDIGGESFDARSSRFGEIVAASNPWTHARGRDDRALRCAKGVPVPVRIRDAHDAIRVLTMTCAAWARSEIKGPAYRKIDDAIGYVDLSHLEVGDVDAMFSALDSTRAIVFDMRGYPRSTAWPIARHLNAHDAHTVAARFARVLIGPSGEEGAEARAQFSQYLPFDASIKHYAGRTVMLVDERTQSQAEHTGLFFEAANGTTFIGSPSAGANGDITGVILPGDAYVFFTGHDVRHADGRQLQRVGLQPDVVVRPTLSGLRQGKDEVLDRALLELRKGLGAAPR